MKGLLQKARVLLLIAVPLTLVVTFLPNLVFAEEGQEGCERSLIERLTERYERDELTLRDLFHALGKPVCEDMLLVEGLAERAKKGELTLREWFEGLGRPLSAVPREAWDARVFVRLNTKVVPREVTGDLVTKEHSDTGRVQPAVLIHYWAKITRISATIIAHEAGILTSEPLFWLAVTSRLQGPKTNQDRDFGFFRSQVWAWDIVYNLPPGVYFTQGVYEYFDPITWPPSDRWDAYAGPIVLP